MVVLFGLVSLVWLALFKFGSVYFATWGEAGDQNVAAGLERLRDNVAKVRDHGLVWFSMVVLFGLVSLFWLALFKFGSVYFATWREAGDHIAAGLECLADNAAKVRYQWFSLV